MNIYNILPGDLLHMDFCFLDRTLIRKFTCALVVVNTKVRKMWKIFTPGKRLPLVTVNFLLEQLKQIGRQVVDI